MRVFESLNCILCKRPFVPIAGQPRSPRLLLCGSAICHECFEKEKSLKQGEREHKCDGGEACFYNSNFAYCVIDVLSQDCFTLSPILGGYLLMKPLVNPECPICHDEYSNKDASKEAFFFGCNHLVCTECYQKSKITILKQNNDIATRAKTSRVIMTSGENRRKDWLQDFLKELPEMTCQLEEMNKTGYRFCDECKKLDIVDEMYHCNKCLLQLCGNCTYKNHRSHKAITLLQKEASLMSHELCYLSISEVQTYHQLFSGLHKELSDGLQGFDQKLLKKKRDLTNASTFEDLREKHKKCTELKTDFEKCSEEYMPHVRKYEKRVQELMKTLDDDPN
ncbi:unnamed protein product, partial [Mesorhabditis belari]|uniref:RING-type domain-containing protein n=1 Tax=Mesorhabditis belari TaxID=2138241 RepID=A0AAF3EHF5_9BILA